MKIIEAWASRGYSLRYLLAEALLTFTDKETHQDDYSSALEQILTILQELRVEPGPGNGQVNQDKRLSEPFLNAIAKATRPGLRIE
jgi:hypothetical protein